MYIQMILFKCDASASSRMSKRGSKYSISFMLVESKSPSSQFALSLTK